VASAKELLLGKQLSLQWTLKGLRLSTDFHSPSQCCSSIGRILKSSGVRITSIKIDPYLNVDAGVDIFGCQFVSI
jgi:hypothetical protein